MSKSSDPPPDASVLVWDLPTRLFHWLLVVTLLGSWVTHELGLEWTGVHMWLGYTALSLVVFRILWGFIGPAHARFSAFLVGPSRTVHYAKAWIAGDPPRYTGHNPLGGWAILAMLVTVLVQGVSGLFNGDEILYSGPWHGAVSGDFVEIVEEVHEINFGVLLALVVLHVGAILSYWLRWRVDLLRPMFSGRKPPHLADPGKALVGQRLVLAVIVLGFAAGLIWLVVSSAPAPRPEDFF